MTRGNKETKLTYTKELKGEIFNIIITSNNDGHVHSLDYYHY